MSGGMLVPMGEKTERALLLTDLVASTRMARTLGDERVAEVGAALDRLTRDRLKRGPGREIDKTDGYFLLFPDAAEAVAFALGEI